MNPGDALFATAFADNDVPTDGSASGEYTGGTWYPLPANNSGGSTTLGSDASMSTSVMVCESATIGTGTSYAQVAASFVGVPNRISIRVAIRAAQTGQSIEYTGSGGVKLGGAAQYGQDAGINYSASGGVRIGGFAAYLYTHFDGYESQSEGGLALGGRSDARLEFAPIPADAVDLVTVTINGQPVSASQITIRQDWGETTATVTAVGDYVGAAGNMTISVIKSVDGQPVFTHQSINLPVTSASRSGDRTTLTASAAGALIGGSFDPDKIQMIGSGMVRAAPDFRVTPGCRYQGAVIQSVVTTLGVNSPWFTEVRF
jgi:hypothetical protein